MLARPALPVSAQPSCTLTRWRFAERSGEWCFAGFCLESQTLRVSTAIEQFDADSMTGVTHSGRAYRLVGPPATDEEAALMQTLWLFAKLEADVVAAAVALSAVNRPAEH